MRPSPATPPPAMTPPPPTRSPHSSEIRPCSQASSLISLTSFTSATRTTPAPTPATQWFRLRRPPAAPRIILLSTPACSKAAERARYRNRRGPVRTPLAGRGRRPRRSQHGSLRPAGEPGRVRADRVRLRRGPLVRRVRSLGQCLRRRRRVRPHDRRLRRGGSPSFRRRTSLAQPSSPTAASG